MWLPRSLWLRDQDVCLQRFVCLGYGVRIPLIPLTFALVVSSAVSGLNDELNNVLTHRRLIVIYTELTRLKINFVAVCSLLC
jgi:hypothetical protein